MKINIGASSNFMGKSKIIEVASIDEAISILLTDKELVKSIIDEDYSRVSNHIPTEFIVKTYSLEDSCSFEIEIYDYYRE